MNALTEIALFFALALVVAPSAAALTPSEYGVARQNADAQYKLELEQCKSLGGNARDVCVKDAKAVRDSARADAYAAFKGTPEARAEAIEDKAEARYRAARQRCEPLGGDERGACIKRALAERARGQAAAAELRRLADAKSAGTRERCDDLSGEARERCSADQRAKSRK